jgi:hypothetical protein
MDFTCTEEQKTISKLARDVFDRRATPQRPTELEAGEIRYFLWAKHHELTPGPAAPQLAHLGSTYPEGRP